MSKNTRNRILLTAVAALLLVVMTVGGTLAWLLDTTDPVENVFTTTNVDIELDESDDLDLELVPGKTITKDPKVTVIAGSEKCYVFVVVTETFPTGTNYKFADFLPYTMADGWTSLGDDNANVYWKLVASADTDTELVVLANNTITVPNTVTNVMMDAVEGEKIKLTFQAYAIQAANGATEFTPAQAWSTLNGDDVTIEEYETPVGSTEGTQKAAPAT